MPFIAGGFGGSETTTAAIRGAANGRASVVEIGVPFSDPVADGPAIQAAYHDALETGATSDSVLGCYAAAKVDVPALAMVSYSIVFRHGVEAFCVKARQHGLSGLLCPDLPAGEAERFAEFTRGHELAPILLVAPTTPARRREQIGKLGGGFIYYLSTSGITGERDALPPELAEGIGDMRQHTDLPIAVGFGIHKPEHLRQLQGVAEAAIVGTALVREVDRTRVDGPMAVETAVRGFCGKLLGEHV